MYCFDRLADCAFRIYHRPQSPKNAIGSFKKLAPGTLWFVPGLMGLVAAFMILAFYGVVAGWTLEYLFKALTNSFVGKNPADLEGMFGGFISQLARPIFWQFIIMGLTCWIVVAGIKGGIEKASKLLMPVLLVIIIILDIRDQKLLRQYFQAAYTRQGHNL